MRVEADLVRTDRDTDRQTDKPTTVTLASACARRGLITFITLINSTDINECVLNTDDCDHICSNNVGSYQCTCLTGYGLASDQHSCEGKYPLYGSL